MNSRKRLAPQSEKTLRQIFEFAPDAIITVKKDGRISAANRQTELMFGYKRSELLGIRLELLIPERFRKRHPQHRTRYYEAPRTRPMGSGLELYARRKDGSEFPVDIMLSPIQGQAHLEVIAIVRDITERKRAEEEKFKLMNLVGRSVAHDLRNPLTAIRTAAYNLGEGSDSDDMKSMLELIDSNVEAADKIVMNLMDFASEVKPSIGEVDVNPLIQEVFREIVFPRNIKLTTRLGELPKAKVDRDRLKRVLGNLFANALESMTDGGELTLSTTATNGRVDITIEDTGKGITEENMKKLMTPFFTTKAKGMGLGLATSRRFIEGQGGTIRIESQEGRGTIVKIELLA